MKSFGKISRNNMKLTSVFRSGPLELAYFETVRRFIQFLAVNPYEPVRWWTIIKILANLSVLVTAFVGEFNFSLQSRNNLFEALQGLGPAVTKTVTWIKLVSFLVVRSELSTFSNNILNHLKEETKSDEAKKAMVEKTCAFTNLWPWIVISFGMSTAFSYALLPMIYWGYRYISGERGMRVALPFTAALPYKDMSRVKNHFVYAFVYCVLGYSGVVTVLGYSIVDGGFMVYCRYLIVMSECLERDFKQAFQQHAGDCDPVSKNSDLLYFKLCKLIRRQYLIHDFVKELNRLYKYQILVQLLQDGIILGVISVNLLLAPGLSKAIYATYALACIIQPLSYCYGADSLNRSDWQLAETLYFLEWYKFDKRVRNLILLGLVRAQRGNPIQVPFFNPSLPLLTAIFKTSGSYITLLMTFF